MPDAGYIPPATAEKLLQPIPKGQRHATAMQIAISLVGNGWSAPAVFAELRNKFEDDVTDREISDIVNWAVQQNPTPSVPNGSRYRGVVGEYLAPGTFVPRVAAPPPTAPPTRTPTEQCDWWTSGARMTPEQMVAASPTPIPDEPSDQCILMLSALYSPLDSLNIVRQFTRDGEKTRPSGAGRVSFRDDWISWIQQNGVPSSEAGAWFRINPCAPVGTGAGGAITDADVVDFRYLLVESDSLPVPMQLAIYSRLRLPVALVESSGGVSAHAWIHLGASDAREYETRAARVLSLLKPFGVDQANKNPSRLSRLPGAMRQIGGVDGGFQRLLWLNSTTSGLTDQGLKDFEESLLLPAIEERPLLSTAQRAVERYEDMRANVGRLGVPMGITELDAISGGMKPGQTIVVAGETGGGKTTVALHMIDSALRAGYGVLLFSLEMDRDEIFDLTVSNRSNVNRNKFNTGAFTDFDLEQMGAAMGEISQLPLYIEDSAMTGVDQIRPRVLQLKKAGKIDLVVVDYIQFVNPGWTKDNREQQIATISHALRAMARETRLPFVVLSQLNDEGKLRESRVIAHNANVVLLVTVEGNTVTVKTVKGRGIPSGEEYQLGFDRSFARLIPTPPQAPTADVPTPEARPTAQRELPVGDRG